MRIVIQGINPEPWTTGAVQCWGKGKGTLSPHPKLVNYQKAIREDLEQRGIQLDDMLFGVQIHMRFYRSTERGHTADATNLQKATEDALQGILFSNDRGNRKVTGEVMEQGPHVQHVGIIIDVEEYVYDDDEHDALAQLMVAAAPVAFEGSDYIAPDDAF